MDERLRRFVADDGWLFVAVVTFGLTSLAGLAGLGALAGAITIVGWFVLTPILLFWGEEVAAVLDDRSATASMQESDSDAETRADPLEELKRRYAAGEIDDAEFERRLERLVAVDELPDDVFGGEATGDGSASETGPADEFLAGERERERER